MSRGKRYDPDQQLNLKKVFAVLIAIVVIIMFVVAIKTILKQGETKQTSSAPITYFSVYTNGKWGVINSNGDYVIEPTYEEMVVVINKEKPVFLCTYDVNYDDGTYKTKAIDASGKQVFADYENIEPIENYDSSNKMWYETNLLRVQKDGKYGMINIDGTSIVACEFDKVYALKGYKDKIVTVKDNLYGLVDNSGKTLVYNENNSDETVIQKCSTEGITLELTTVPAENSNPKNIGKWHISKDENSSYYTDTND